MRYAIAIAILIALSIVAFASVELAVVAGDVPVELGPAVVVEAAELAPAQVVEIPTELGPATILVP